MRNEPHRREFLAAAAGTALGISGAAAAPRKALIAISLDLEMSRQYPTRDQMHWDYEKGNLDEPTKRYSVEAAERVKANGGLIHFFSVARVMEQENIDWIKRIAAAGHPIGNHTYDHVNVKATRLEDVQFRFKRAPWLAEGKSVSRLIADNIKMGHEALKTRAGIEVAGFRTPGGFNDGLADRPDIRKMLMDQGYRWVSSLYPAHPTGKPGEPPTEAVFDAIIAAQKKAQPFAYPDGLVEVPMSPVSDVTSMRSGGWPLEAFLEAVRRGVSWAIDNGAVYDFLAHPSCLVVTDPKFRAIDLICELVKKAGDRAQIVDLQTVARSVTR